MRLATRTVALALAPLAILAAAAPARADDAPVASFFGALLGAAVGTAYQNTYVPPPQVVYAPPVYAPPPAVVYAPPPPVYAPPAVVIAPAYGPAYPYGRGYWRGEDHFWHGHGRGWRRGGDDDD